MKPLNSKNNIIPWVKKGEWYCPICKNYYSKSHYMCECGNCWLIIHYKHSKTRLLVFYRNESLKRSNGSYYIVKVVRAYTISPEGYIASEAPSFEGIFPVSSLIRTSCDFLHINRYMDHNGEIKGGITILNSARTNGRLRSVSF